MLFVSIKVRKTFLAFAQPVHFICGEEAIERRRLRVFLVEIVLFKPIFLPPRKNVGVALVIYEVIKVLRPDAKPPETVPAMLGVFWDIKHRVDDLFFWFFVAG